MAEYIIPRHALPRGLTSVTSLLRHTTDLRGALGNRSVWKYITLGLFCFTFRSASSFILANVTMKFTAVTAVLAALVSAVCSVAAAPSVGGANTARDVWDPKILSPNSTTTWVSGNTYTVVWDTTDRPKEITSTNGHIILANEGVEYTVLLAWNFDLLDGQVEVTVPPVYTEDGYQIVLFGDSGNLSEEFTIDGPFTP
ncbi:hypothetical protein NM688_g6270 [Phlebia brevispora]|uniref:Uncharacterized protein n=1 Tax=Phlebia brevispora TaxID=194682 RepID=A0ACC1SI68_9APHY|nr:hypothetical protein NM688_g6270 [Phlebia brevispora]